MRLTIRPMLAGLLVAGSGAAQATLFTDWTSMNTVAEAASGTVAGTTIFLQGKMFGNISDGIIDGTGTYFSSAAFSPSLPTSDGLILKGGFLGANYLYTVTFGEQVLDPVLHLHSLASTLWFDPGTSISKLSGDAGLVVNGTDVSGEAYQSTDANGTIRLNGTYTSFSFYAYYGIGGQTEDFTIQIGATAISDAPVDPDPGTGPGTDPAAAVPEPSVHVLTASALLLMAAVRRRRHR